MTRRRLLSWLPAFAHHYGIRPWEIERLTFREIAAFQRDLKRQDDEVKKAQRQARTARRR